MTDPSISDVIETTAFLFFAMAWKSSLILGSVYLIAIPLKRLSASIRLTIFSAAILATLVIVVSSAAGSRLTIFVLEWPSATMTGRAVVADTIEYVATVNESKSLNLLAKPTSISTLTVVEATIVAIWLTTALALFTRLFLRLCGLRRLRTASTLVTDPRINNLTHDALQRLGYRSRSITLLQNDLVLVPITWGVLGHVMLLPRGFQSLPRGSQRAIITHESTHIGRNDFVFRILAEVVCAIVWFQPLSWVVRRRLCDEQERSSDDRVLSTGERPSIYARLLLECHDRLSVEKRLPIALGVVERNNLRSRIDAVLNPSLGRSPATFAVTILICLLMFGMMFPVTMLGLKVTAKSEQETENTTAFASISAPERALKINEHKPAGKTGAKVIGRDRPQAGMKFVVSLEKTRGADASLGGATQSVQAVNTVDDPSTLGSHQTDRVLNTASGFVTQANTSRSKPPRLKAGEMVENIFKNIRNGFKNGKTPINVLVP